METSNKKMTDLKKKIIIGLNVVSEKLIKESKEKRQELVVIRDNKMIRLKFSN